MSIKKNELSWLVVSDLNKARRFYKEVLGLEELTYDEQFGWAELSLPEGGTRIGLALEDSQTPIKPGSNAVVTFSVDDIEKTKKELSNKGVDFVGDIMVIPGHVKLQLLKDLDGNYFQLVEKLGSFD